MCVDGEGFSIVDEVVLDGSLHKHCIPHVHIGTSKHNSTYNKWKYI